MNDKRIGANGYDNVRCPLVEDFIEDIDCIENRAIVDGEIVETSMPERFKMRRNWRELCRKCKWHNY